MKKLGLVFLLFFCFAPLHAQEIDDTGFPSYRLVLDTEIPALDRYDLARRFLGSELSLELPKTPPERAVGDRDEFYVAVTSNGGGMWIDAELAAIGEHVFLWLETGLNASDDRISTLVERFDYEVYEFVRGLWGEEALGIDGEERLHILVTGQLPENLGGFYSSSNQYPSELVPFSNERDLLIMSNIVLLPYYQEAAISTAAHELQHLIHAQRDENEDVWMSEGFATLTEHLIGLEAENHLFTAFAGMPSTQLNSWGMSDNRYPNYGASMMFNIYLHDRFGLERMQALVGDRRNGFAAVSATMGMDANLIFADWVLANFLREESGDYSYSSLPDFPQMSLAAPPIFRLPSSQQRVLNQYSTAYFQVMNPSDTVNISLSLPETISLFPAASDWVWYSLRGDNSNPHLTRAFDLRNLQSAQLDYRIWYSLEDNWDYAYLTISRDNGASWEILNTPNMDEENLYGRAYGIGYTGESDGWLDESISLDTYVGSEILLRFEMLTDDSINQPGIALDDIRLADYSSDFEVDGGGWQAEGWIRSDNRLPQYAWLQIIEHQGSENIVTRHLVRGQGQWTINLDAETTQLSIALSPFAPMTTEGIAYELQIEGD